KLEIDFSSDPNDENSTPDFGGIAVAEDLLIHLNAQILPDGPVDAWPQLGDNSVEGDFENAANHPTQNPGFMVSSAPFVESITAPLGLTSSPVPGDQGDD
ncbi:MAG: hypothetical protein GWO24_27295, partial [Akkermansiaceae bacterium]|nr:hypothetical protein [Akkermansiaceae bacterium]